MKRINIASGSPWESIVGYSRAVRIGNCIEVSGTTATSNGEVVFNGDLYGQTKFILARIIQSIEDAGGSAKDVIRTRMYVTDISQWEAAAKAHAEFFGEILPTTSMVEVSKLIDPDHLIEIEASAVCS